MSVVTGLITVALVVLAAPRGGTGVRCGTRWRRAAGLSDPDMRP